MINLLKNVKVYMEEKETVETMPELYLEVCDAIEHIEIYEMVEKVKNGDVELYSEEQIKDILNLD